MLERNDAGRPVAVPGSIRVLMPNGQVEEMKLETYLAGAVAMEIGSGAPIEALKAQAVASRTYAAAAHRHPEVDADVCTTTHCQEWRRVDPIVAPEVFRAISETWGIVAVHDGKLIDAFFFEHCDGHTRNSEDVLMPDLPYLRSVACACGFVAMKGHGVGLCQRGAIVMARRGASFERILRHYYRGVVMTHTAHEGSERVVEAKPAPPTETLEKVTRPAAKARPPAKKAQELVRAKHTKLAKVKREKRAPLVRAKPLMPTPRVVLPEPVLAEAAARAAAPIPVKKETVPTVEMAPVETFPTTPSETVPSPAKVSPPLEPTLKTTAPSETLIAASAPVEPVQVPAYVEQLNALTAPAVPSESLQAPAYVEQLNALTAPAASNEPSLEGLSPAQEMTVESAPPALDEEVSVVSARIHIDHLPGVRMIAGRLACAGLVVGVEDEHGNKTTLLSGSAPHYGVGGFEKVVDEDGRYFISIDDQVIEVNVQGDTVFIHANSAK
jgi:hypothetical protein